MSDYEVFKNLVKIALTNKYQENGSLKADEIVNQIDKTKEILENKEFASTLFKFDEELNEGHFARMTREFEENFNVKMDTGIIIQGEEQRQRDKSWWGDKAKFKQENYYFERFKSYIREKLPPNIAITLDDDSDIIMNNLGDPKDDSFEIFGMVVGSVQSGKTMNYASLLCKGADAGYKFIVVIAGDKNNLRAQTQKRINEYFIGQNEFGKSVGVGLDKKDKSKMPISLTTENNDFNNKDADKHSQGLNFDNVKAPIVLVIKKNYRTLQSVIKWLKNQYPNKIQAPMLVIDDEADYASINTKKDEDDPTKINKLIRTLLKLFQKSSYVAYTATPFANIFIDNDISAKPDFSKDLFPRDFIYALDAPSNYFGARKVFDEDSEFVVEIKDYEEHLPIKHKKDFILQDLPQSLYEAINVFCLNIAIRHLREQKSHNSMLINISRFKNLHEQIYMKTREYLENIKHDIKAFGKLKNAINQSKIIKEFYALLDSKFKVEFKHEQIIAKLSDIIHTISVKEEHSASKNRINYSDDSPMNIIAIGGLALSRGFTLEGLSVSYFVRNSIFYDTLMQMGRWFGYRVGYEDLCKIYMPFWVRDNFTQIAQASDELMDSFRQMALENKTPNDFGLAVMRHPDSALQVTAKNKRHTAQEIPVQINFNGRLVESTRLYKDTKINEQNLALITNLVGQISPKFQKVSKRKDNLNFIARNLSKDLVLNFMKEFKVVESYYGKVVPIMDLLKNYIEQKDDLWDIMLHSGSGDSYKIANLSINKEKRRISEKENFMQIDKLRVLFIQQLKYAIDENKLKNLEAKIKEKKQNNKIQENDETNAYKANLNNPLLMLHILQPENLVAKAVAAFGVCFPLKSISDESRNINYVINKRKFTEMLQENEEDEDE